MNKILILSSTLLILSSCCTNNNYLKNGLTGIINVRGHEPFVYLSIETAEGKIFEIESPDSLQNILWDLQGLKVTLKIEEMKKHLERDIAVVTSHEPTPWTKNEMEK